VPEMVTMAWHRPTGSLSLRPSSVALYGYRHQSSRL